MLLSFAKVTDAYVDSYKPVSQPFPRPSSPALIQLLRSLEHNYLPYWPAWIMDWENQKKLAFTSVPMGRFFFFF